MFGVVRVARSLFGGPFFGVPYFDARIRSCFGRSSSIYFGEGYMVLIIGLLWNFFHYSIRFGLRCVSGLIYLRGRICTTPTNIVLRFSVRACRLGSSRGCVLMVRFLFASGLMYDIYGGTLRTLRREVMITKACFASGLLCLG